MTLQGDPAPCDIASLAEQFGFIRPIEKAEHHDNNKDRWKAALVGVARASNRTAVELSAIKRAFWFGFFKPTTSPIEGEFTKQNRVMSAQQHHCAPAFEEATFRISSALLSMTDADSLAALAKQSQKSWCRLGLGVARASGKIMRPHKMRCLQQSKPIDDTKHVLQNPLESIEAALHRAQTKQRAAELKGMDADNATLAAAIAAVHPDQPPAVNEWTDAQTKELAWLEDKQLKKKITVVREGLLEVSGPECDVLKGLAGKEHDRITEALAAKVSTQNKDKVSDPMADIKSAYEDLKNASVWFRHVPDPDWHGWKVLQEHNVVRVDDLMDADLIVVADDVIIALEPKHRWCWIATMGGLKVCNLALLERRFGAVLFELKLAFLLILHIPYGRRFLLSHKDVVDFIAKTKPKWKFVESRARLKALIVTKAALVSYAEKRAEAFKSDGKALTVQDFMTRITNVRFALLTSRGLRTPLTSTSRTDPGCPDPWGGDGFDA